MGLHLLALAGFVLAASHTDAAPWTGFFEALPAQQPIPHPTLLGIGFVKTGTTDFAKYLHQFLDGNFNIPRRKELRGLLLPNLLDNQADIKFYQQQLNITGPYKYTVDMTPLYISWPQPLVNAQKLFGALRPHMLIMMRNPIKQVISWINYEKGRINSTMINKYFPQMDVDATLSAELSLLQRPETYARILQAVNSQDPFEGWLQYLAVQKEIDLELAAVFEDPDFSNYGWGYITTALYYPHVRAWLHGLSAPNKTLIVISESWFSSRPQVVQDAVMPFLFGPDSSVWPKVQEGVQEVKIFNHQDEYSMQVSPRVQCEIQRFLHPFVCMLQQLLQDHPNAQTYPPTATEGNCTLWSEQDFCKSSANKQ